MEFTFELARLYGISPFEILKEETELVIMSINYIYEKSEREDYGTVEDVQESYIDKQGKKVKRIKVNDATATGGWW